jgi:hypothetical protein
VIAIKMKVMINSKNKLCNNKEIDPTGTKYFVFIHHFPLPNNKKYSNPLQIIVENSSSPQT